MTQSHPLPMRRPLPLRLQSLIEHAHWGELIRAFSDGLSPNLVHEGDHTLFGAVSLALAQTGPSHTSSAAYGPLALVEAFIGHGLEDASPVSGSGTVIEAAASGQWAWLKPLLLAGHRIQPPKGKSIFHALIEGRMARRLSGREEAWDGEETEIRSFPFNADLPLEVDYVHEAVRLLVAHGACLDDVEAEADGSSPITALMLAVQYNDLPAVEALLHAGASVLLSPGEDIFGINQDHPLAIATLSGLDQVLDTLLLHSGLDVLGHHGVDAMHLAAAKGHLSCMRVLNVHGVDYRAPTRMGDYSPLHQAALHGRTHVIDFLLDHGAKWSDGPEDSMSAAAVLQANQPALARRYGVSQDQGNIVPISIVKRGVAKAM